MDSNFQLENESKYMLYFRLTSRRLGRDVVNNTNQNFV